MQDTLILTENHSNAGNNVASIEQLWSKSSVRLEVYN